MSNTWESNKVSLGLVALVICFEQCVGKVLVETFLVELGTKIDWRGGWPGQEEGY